MDYNHTSTTTYVAIDGNKIYDSGFYCLYDDNIYWLYWGADESYYVRQGAEWSAEDWKTFVKSQSKIYNFAKLLTEDPDWLKYDASSKTYKATDIEGEQAYKIYEAEYGFELSEDFKEGFKYKLAEVEIKLGKIRRVTLGNSVYECMMTRENGDISFTCTLPVKKEQIPLAKMFVVFGLQCIIMLSVGIMGAIKGAFFPIEQYFNYSGISANLVLVGNGAILLGIFNLVFFPRYFKKPDKIGVPFVTSVIVIFLLIGVFIVLRWVTPLYSTTLNGINSENTGAKLVALAIGIVIYAVLSVVSCKLSMRHFQKVDL